MAARLLHFRSPHRGPSFSYPFPAILLRFPITTTTRRPRRLAGAISQSKTAASRLAGPKSQSKNAPSPGHLTKRTRSDMELDRGLYDHYSAGEHVPVLLGEVLEVFRPPHRLRSFVDCTLGAGGHSAAVIEAHGEMEVYVGMDVDQVAYGKAKARIEALVGDGENLKVYTRVKNFKYVRSVLGDVDEKLVENGVDGILMDLGMSSMQVDHAERGFSVLGDGPLDMRMDLQSSLKAEDIVNSWPESEVGRILRDYGEDSNWHYLAKRMVEARGTGGMHSTVELVHLIRSASTKSGGRQGWIKTATRVFQALRIAVNDELTSLEDALYACFRCLSSGGRLAVISFHSLEDRIVKQTFLKLIDREMNEYGQTCTTDLRSHDIKNKGVMRSNQKIQGKKGYILTKRPITPSQEEERFNWKCRSAKLRVIQKI